MPANLPPQYFEAEKVYRQAKTPEDKIEALERMLAIMPKHKGTDKLRADLRTRIAKCTQEAERQSSVVRRGSAYNVPREGAGQVALVGLPNVGKSQLVSMLTDAVVDVADYPFTTKMPFPGMMRFENIQIQLLDMPPITDREARPWFSHILRNADILLIVVDLGDDPVMQFEAVLVELDGMKVQVTTDEPEGELMPGIARKRVLVVGNKVELDGLGRGHQALSSLHGGKLRAVTVSAKEGTGLEELKRVVFDELDIMRVYTKSPGKKPDFEDPIILRRGGTVEEAAESVHKDFRSRLKYAQLWGSGKFDGQRAKRGHVLEDGDVVELHL